MLLYVSSAGGSWKGEKETKKATKPRGKAFKRGDTNPKCSLIAQERMSCSPRLPGTSRTGQFPAQFSSRVAGKVLHSFGNGFWGSSCPRISLATDTFLLPSSNFP